MPCPCSAPSRPPTRDLEAPGRTRPKRPVPGGGVERAGTSGRAAVAIDFNRLTRIWSEEGSGLRWPAIFDLPAWLESWWSCLAGRAEMLLLAVTDGGRLIGVAPLMVQGGSAAFIGDPDVCDHHDFIVAPGQETAFYSILMDELAQRGVGRLDLHKLRPDSSTLAHLPETARRLGLKVGVEKAGLSLETDLPGDWEAYLTGLTPKHRHEIRRKLRRLFEAGEIAFTRAEGPDQVGPALEIFMDLFRRSRADKEEFLTPEREAFLRALVPAMAGAGRLRLFTLFVGSRPAASTLCFDLHRTRYLYNNGYDSSFKACNVGTMCKVLSLKDALEEGLERYDFLNGNEPYKHRLGGREQELSRCTVEMTSLIGKSGIDRGC